VDALPPEALLEAYSPPIRDLAEQLRAIVRAAVPDAIERVRGGWRLIGYDLVVGRGRSRTTFFAWIAPEPGHVHLGFVHGTLLADPDGVLRGRGITKRARWLTFGHGDTIDVEVARRLLEDAVAVARRDPRERHAELTLVSETGADANG
jgi:hypothetical protein